VPTWQEREPRRPVVRVHGAAGAGGIGHDLGDPEEQRFRDQGIGIDEVVERRDDTDIDGASGRLTGPSNCRSSRPSGRPRRIAGVSMRASCVLNREERR
jgi:hypothetical protein